MEKIKRKNRGSDLAMTTEQREAIDRLNRFKTIQVLYGNTCAMHIEQLKTLQVNISTVLSLIKEQQEEIEKKDKQIDLMAEIFYKRFKAELLLEYGFES